MLKLDKTMSVLKLLIGLENKKLIETIKVSHNKDCKRCFCFSCSVKLPHCPFFTHPAVLIALCTKAKYYNTLVIFLSIYFITNLDKLHINNIYCFEKP